MSEWWTYRPSDFLLFSARTYYRLFEIHNAALWPAQALAMALGGVLLWLAWRGGRGTSRAACAMVAAAWVFMAGAWFLWRYATINWAAAWFGAFFVVEAALLFGLASARACPALISRTPTRALSIRRGVGTAFLLAALAYPLLAPLLGRPWTQAEVPGLMPDPTAIGTLGLLLLLDAGEERRLPPAVRMAWMAALWAIPVGWCLISGMTLWTLRAPEAMIPPALAALALVASAFDHRPSTA